eukprot:TRINITY_DN3115_c3_g1_i1.p1 TRINITY_DN3115_c3_g1~~TRINITY_DN3115_c3_g1_i1.p1  ORF type:complete len:147 (+),score=19.79 TRINITY_DN3115_c3_g1_i1:109-549(+)
MMDILPVVMLLAVPILTYGFWKADGFNRVLRRLGIQPTAGRGQRAASAAAASASAGADEPTLHDPDNRHDMDKALVPYPILEAPTEVDGGPARRPSAFGADDLDQLITTYHWEETERSQRGAVRDAEGAFASAAARRTMSPPDEDS